MKRYRYMNGDIVYLHIGTAIPAGAARKQDMPPMEIYQNPSTGELYYRTVEDFAERMSEVPNVLVDAVHFLSAQNNMQKEMPKGSSGLQKDQCDMLDCCESCRSVAFTQNTELWTQQITMICCPVCGNKRCPKAQNHIFKCTGSNAVGQTGELE